MKSYIITIAVLSSLMFILSNCSKSVNTKKENIENVQPASSEMKISQSKIEEWTKSVIMDKFDKEIPYQILEIKDKSTNNFELIEVTINAENIIFNCVISSICLFQKTPSQHSFLLSPIISEGSITHVLIYAKEKEKIIDFDYDLASNLLTVNSTGNLQFKSAL